MAQDDITMLPTQLCKMCRLPFHAKLIVKYCSPECKKDAQPQSNQYRRKRKQRINKLKETACADCGIKYPPYVMDFDHVRGKKLGTITELVRIAKIETILAEIKKCELVCANCHRIRTHTRRHTPISN